MYMHSQLNWNLERLVFLGEAKTRVAREKNPRSKGENY